MNEAKKSDGSRNSEELGNDVVPPPTPLKLDSSPANSIRPFGTGISSADKTMIPSDDIESGVDRNSDSRFAYDELYKANAGEFADADDDFDEAQFILFDTVLFNVNVEVFFRQFVAHMLPFLAPCLLENPRAQGFYDFTSWNQVMFNVVYPVMCYAMVVCFWATADRNQEVLSGAVYMVSYQPCSISHPVLQNFMELHI